MNYEMKDLKEGRIIVFKNFIYGIITKENPGKDENDKNLICLYENGNYNDIQDIINLDYTLFESDTPMWSFINLSQHIVDFTEARKDYDLKIINKLKPVNFIQAVKSEKKIRVEHEYINDLINANIDELEDYIPLIGLMDILCDNLVTSELSEVILNGRWYIKNEEN